MPGQRGPSTCKGCEAYGRRHCLRLGVLGPQAQQEAYLLAARFTDLRQRWALPLQRLIANCARVHVGEKGKNGAHAFAAVVHLHVCSSWGRCCGAGTHSYLSTTHSRTHSRTRSRIQGRRRSRTRGSISCWRRRGCYRHEYSQGSLRLM